MMEKLTVLYARYSSDMQRPTSCSDQERDTRKGLGTKGLDTSNALVIHDEAESGTKTSRDGFQQLQALIAAGRVGVLAVDDQSRLTRADNAYAFITDLVYAGGRFISTGENIDTNEPGWELKVKVLELHHSQTIRDLQHRVRRGQLSRVLDDGSTGDFPFGYESYYLDADWQAQLARRGPKPKKGLRIFEDEAQWVRQIFEWFIDGKSIGWIARKLTELKVPKGRRATTPGWHPQQVHRILTNRKYIGQWLWGDTTTIRNSKGVKKQVSVPKGQAVPRNRPNLRIIPQDVWDRAEARLADMSSRFGYKPGQKKRGPKPPANPTDAYPRSMLGGLLMCQACGAAMWYHGSGGRRYYSCSGHKKGLCQAAFQVPADKAETEIVTFLTGLLTGWPDWLRDVVEFTRAAVLDMASRIPVEREQEERRLGEVKRKLANIVKAIEEGDVKGSAVAERMAALEGEQVDLERRVAGYGSLDLTRVCLPDDAWVQSQMSTWAANLSAEEGARLLRDAISGLSAEAVIAPGKKRGYPRIRLQVRYWQIFLSAVGSHFPIALIPLLAIPSSGVDSPEYVIDLGEPTKMEAFAPQIAAWREEGVTWEEIVQRTGMDLNRVYVAWKRFVTSRGDDTSAA